MIVDADKEIVDNVAGTLKKERKIQHLKQYASVKKGKARSSGKFHPIPIFFLFSSWHRSPVLAQVSLSSSLLLKLIFASFIPPFSM